MYIQPLREANEANTPIIATDRLEQFIKDVFHNYHELYAHHKRLVDKFHQIQQQQHPQIRSITAAMFDAALNFRDAYMEYIPNYPIAAYRIDDELANNPTFKQFVEVRCSIFPFAKGSLRFSRPEMRETPGRAQAGHEEFHQPAYPQVAAV